MKSYWKAKKKNKYGAKRSGEFDSGLEASVHQMLCLREKAGEIEDIQRQVSVVLQDGPREERITVTGT